MSRAVLALLVLALCGCAQKAAPIQLMNTYKNVRSLAFSSDGKLLIGGQSGGHILVWDARSGKQLRDFEAHDGDVVGVAFTGEGLVSAGSKGEFKVWDTESWACKREQDTQMKWITRLAATPGGKIALITSGGRHTAQPARAELQIWGTQLQQRQPAPGAEAIAFSPDGETLAVGTSANITLVGRSPGTLNSPGTALCYAESLAAGGYDGVVRVFNPTSHEQERQLNGGSQPVLDIAYHKGQWLTADGHALRIFGKKDKTQDLDVAVLASSPSGALATAGHALVQLLPDF